MYNLNVKEVLNLIIKQTSFLSTGGIYLKAYSLNEIFVVQTEQLKVIKSFSY